MLSTLNNGKHSDKSPKWIHRDGETFTRKTIEILDRMTVCLTIQKRATHKAIYLQKASLGSNLRCFRRSERMSLRQISPHFRHSFSRIQTPIRRILTQDTEMKITEPMQFFRDLVSTPIGSLMIAADLDGNLRVALFTENENVLRRQLQLHYGKSGFTLDQASNPHGLSAKVSCYFAGELSAIDAIPVATGGTPFQRKVWQELRNIPCGATTSYGELARRIGHPNAVRAVGAANGDNPIAVVVPCHRVIGANGSLTGYGGGIERKRWLLDHEKRPDRLF
jgi:methylated-DNA-[protein]-cysteine S-methyltransferase